MWKFSGMDTGRFLNIEASNSGASDRGSLKVTWEGGGVRDIIPYLLCRRPMLCFSQ
jgi:hypothetical protein